MKLLVCLALVYSVAASPAWNDLKTTWGVNPLFSKWDFASLPRTVADARSQGWTLKDNGCADSTLLYAGSRYWISQDPAVFLIYDVNGFIAGIQTAIDQTGPNKYVPSAQNNMHPLMVTATLAHLSAYFVNPAIICNGGRTASDYANQGTGTGLWIQNGTRIPEDTIQIPMAEEDMGATKWTDGHCFYTMGQHYWFNVRKDMSCDEFYPFFILYNSGKLNGFGFAINFALTSQRYEHPTVSVAGQFINPLPDCFNTDPSYSSLSTLHVFLDSTPLFNFC